MYSRDSAKAWGERRDGALLWWEGHIWMVVCLQVYVFRGRGREIMCAREVGVG